MLRTLCIFALLVGLTTIANAAEICGNGQDDDADGLADEGCYPTLTTDQCESPLSCGTTGMISPSTGSLRYALPPDVKPRVPYGVNIGFRRFYTSMYSPGSSPPAYRKALGDRWQHTYSTWIDKRTSESPVQIILHTNQGQDVLSKYASTTSGWDYYTLQPGHHVQYFRQRVASPNEYEIKTLTGEVFVYNSAGRLTELWDSLATPNKVLVAYDGNAQVSTVTDASGKRRLLFGYTGSLMTSVAFQLNISSTWTTQHTTTYGYTSSQLTTVTIGGQLAQTNVYTSNYLTQIKDGDNNQIVAFDYDGTTAGRVDRVDTPHGMLGFELSSSRSTCSGKTVLYFNRGNTSSCSVDSDCGTGFLCGGKTGSGSTGQCFRAARCLTISSPSEDVVTSVAAIGPPSQSCEGACVEISQYLWNTTSGSSPILDLGATQDPGGSYTSQSFDANGKVTRIVHADPDSDPTNGNGAREEWRYYDSTFPGKLAEIRRKSELSTATCSQSVATGCARTLFTYSADGKLATLGHVGFDLGSSGTTTSFHYTTTFTYDTKGRIDEIDGPISGTGDLTSFDYHTSSDPTLDGFLGSITQATGSTNLATSALAYDFWGHATTLQDADSTLTCLTFSSARGHLTERREAMAGQTSCSSTDSSDIVTTWSRDSALRLLQVTRPDGSCMFYEYDTKGRLSKTKRRDDCNASSSGDREEYTYDAEGLLTKIETFDASSTVTRRREMTYFDSRRLEKMINPVDTSKWTGFSYDSRGLLTQLDGPNSLSKTTWTIDADRRITAENR